MIYKEMPKEGLNVTQARDLRTSDDIVLNVDVVVVGSGTGGAVIAHELAATGKSVVILEAGRYIPSSQFTEDMAWSLENLYKDVGTQTNTTRCHSVRSCCSPLSRSRQASAVASRMLATALPPAV